jgi:Mrp family chromosome partitioning ATPase
LDGLVRATAIPRVSLVTSGGPVDRPGDLLSSDRMRRAIAEASERADVVIIDTPPILTTSDAAGLIPEVEAVVMVARAGRTSGDVAERTRDLMRGLAAPVVGVALNATTDTSVPRRYYYYSYSHEAPKGRHRGRGLPRLIRSSKAR